MIFPRIIDEIIERETLKIYRRSQNEVRNIPINGIA